MADMATPVVAFEHPSRVMAARAASSSNAQNSPNNSSSASQLLSTLIPVLIYAVVFFSVFLLLRSLYPRVYKPREFLPSLRKSELAPPLPGAKFGWIPKFFTVLDTNVLQTQSIDAFLLLRLLKMAVVTCLVGCLITWPVLFPVNATGPGGQTQLNILTMSNAVSTSDKISFYRYFAHAGCAWLFFGFIIYMITRESIYYINLRQAYLISPLYSNRVSARTVLFTSVPDAYLNEKVLREMLGPGVVNVWIPRDTSKLEEDVKERDKIAYKLEAAETKLILSANANRLKAQKKNKTNAETDDSGDVASRYLTKKQRPTHKLKPLIGKKVDTIDWCREQLREKVPAVDEHQHSFRVGDAKPLNSVFVQFENLRLAQAAFQSLTHHQPLHMAPRYTGIIPSDIIWANLRIKWWERLMRYYAATTFVVLLVIFWSLPVAFIGFVSNIFALANQYSWLSWLNSIPSTVQGVVSGLLPAVLMAVLFALLPIILRLMARVGGAATWSEVEYTTQNYYFAFLVIQQFLVNSLASGAIASLSSILNNPSSAVTLLSQNLPKASNFYLSYFIVQGLGIVGQTLAAIAGLAVFVLLGKLLDKTPRKQFTRWMNLAAPGLGTLYPVYTNLFVIAIAYSCIAPLVLGFAAIGLFLFYFAQRYQAIYIWGAGRDTLGLMYPRALQQLFVGLYIAELCLVGLFAIATGSSRGAIGPLVMMILFIVFTALWHVSLVSALDPLLKYLPKSLETEERRLLAMEDMDNDAEAAATGNGITNGKTGVEEEKEVTPTHTAGMPQRGKKPNPLQKFLRPDMYTDYYTMRKLVPRNFANIEYDEATEASAYYHPSVAAETPLLWVPRDPMGVSRQEVAESSKVIPITDQGATLDEKNKIVWDHEDVSDIPIVQEKIYY